MAIRNWKDIPLFKDVTDEQWNDWHWQVAHRLSTVEDIAQVVNLTDQEKADIEKVMGGFRVGISGTEVVYTCETTLMEKPIVITFELEDLGDNKYNFVIPGGFVFVTAEVIGNTMTYVAGEGEDSSRMVFKRAK